jgi:VWFA-related protein
MRFAPATYLIALLLLGQAANLAPAQQSTTQQTTPSTQSTPPDQTLPPADGGPTGDNGAIAIPKKTQPSTPPPPPPPPAPKNPPGMGNFSLHVNVPVVTVDVGVILEKTHQFVPNLKEENFRVFEDGKPQEITHFQRIQAPITAVLLLEFAANSWWFINDMQNAAYTFAQQLRPDDYIAVVTYDMHTHILTDFTQNKSVVMNALGSLTMPTWNETNLFDALYTTLDRLSRIPGRKYIILVSSGVDTFSKITLDKCLQKVKETPNVTIFSIGTGQFARLMADSRGMGMSGPREMTFLQADNQMSTFARMTGGMSFFPRFEGELPADFGVINASIRNQYSITYTPTDTKQDGTWRKIHVELVDDEGHPLRMQDEKHRQLKYDVIARSGYKAKQEVN